MVAPISFQPRKFLFYNEINQGFKDRGVEVKCYRVFVNTKELFKPYTTNIYQSEGDNRKRIDELIDYNFFELSSKSGKPLAVAWVGITKNLQLIPVFNEAMRIRFRKGNIQVRKEDKKREIRLGCRPIAGVSDFFTFKASRHKKENRI